MNPRDFILMEMLNRRRQAGAPQGGPRTAMMPVQPRPGGRGPARQGGARGRLAGPQAPAAQRRQQAGLLDMVAERTAGERAAFAEAKKLYEEVRPYVDDPDAATERAWKARGADLLEIFDAHPGLERRFAISPTFRQWMQVKGGYVLPDGAPEPVAGTRTPGLGLLADDIAGEPAPARSSRTPLKGRRLL